MDVMTAAQMAIQAWQKGESAGTYADFKKLLAHKFNAFSHPILGTFNGEDAGKICMK